MVGANCGSSIPLKAGNMTVAAVLFFLLAIVMFSTQSFAQAPEGTTARDVLTKLDAWDLPGAEADLAPLLKSDPADPFTRFAAAMVAFHKGRHQEAVKAIEGIDIPEGDSRSMMALIRSSATVTEKYSEAKSAGGHFRLLYPPGPDSVLVHAVLDMLEKARTAVGADLEYLPPEEITVEVVNSPAELSAMTGLTEEEIRTTNTIAVCKFNRLMFTSPAAAAAGYPYLDTLGHEYTHYVVSRKTGNGVEIWLHEAIAKMEESAWRGRPGALRPDHEGLISSALARGKLITFERMSPSMAKLPDADSAALAFAEVFSAGVFIRESAGPDALARMLAAIAAGRDMSGAFEAVGLGSTARFEKAWMADLKKNYSGKQTVDRQFYRSRLKGDSSRLDKAGAQDDVGTQATRQFVRLGDLLMQRGKAAAAAKEFEKATGSSGVKNPVIQNRLSVALLAAGKPGEAAAALQGLSAMYPDFISTYMNLARIASRTGKPAESEKNYRLAAEINPFDHEIWEGIASAAKSLGDRKTYDEAVGNLTLIKTVE
jgi:tetratricopeptide (TPR) repeat protein